MPTRLRKRACLLFALCSACLQCSKGSDAAPGQVVLFIDTNAPIASQALEQDVLRDASVDTLRIDILDKDDRAIAGKTKIIPASDEKNWPISFGLEPTAEANLARLRLRTFRARNAEARTDAETKAQTLEPVAGYTIDRIVEIPLPSKGAYAVRVVLRAECRGKRPDLVHRTTCVDDPTVTGAFTQGIEVLPVEAAMDQSVLPARPAIWWPGNDNDCPADASNDTRVCVPGGFFMLGNLRVVGFGALRRSDGIPAHPVVMKPFLIDREEMTIGRLEAELGPELTSGEIQIGTDKGCSAGVAEPARSKLPVNCISWDEAERVCRKLGGRLPTEAEWEYVASGRGRGFLFPWGDAPPTCESASLGHRPSSAGFAQCKELTQPEPASSYGRVSAEQPDASVDASGSEDAPEEVSGDALEGDDSAAAIVEIPKDEYRDPQMSGGVYDLAGGLSEWTFDIFQVYEKECWERDALLLHPVCCKTPGSDHTVRGGSWTGPLESAYVALRFPQTNSEYNSIGFRCAYSLPTVQGLEPEGQNCDQYRDPPASVP